MISQFFEVQIKEGQVDRYLSLAASLRPSLDAMGGCLFIDRFKSLSRKNLLLSYQIWQDEGSMIAWRVDPTHHIVQETGREKFLKITASGSLKFCSKSGQGSPYGGRNA